MARNASGEFYYPPGTAAVPDGVARSAHVNQRFNELAQDANTPRPVLVGGTGSSTAAGARANLGVAAKAESALLAGTDPFTSPQTIDTTTPNKLTLAGTNLATIIAKDASGAVQATVTFDATADQIKMWVANGATFAIGRTNFTYNGSEVPRMDSRAGWTQEHSFAKQIRSEATNVDQIDIAPAIGHSSVSMKSGSNVGRIIYDGQFKVEADGPPSVVWTDRTSPTMRADVVGALIFATQTTGATVSYGAVVPGANIAPSGITSAGALAPSGSPRSGQWRSLGTIPNNGAGMFVKISS